MLTRANLWTGPKFFVTVSLLDPCFQDTASDSFDLPFSSSYSHHCRKLSANMAETTAFEAMDSASATLILQMLETDSEELLSGGKGKGKEGDLSDRDLATGLFLEELRQQRVIIADRAMSHSITRAVITDADVLNDFAAQEQIATQDRAAAVNLLHGNRIETPQQHANHDPSAVDENVVTRLFGLYVLPVSSPTKASHKFLSCEDDDNESIGESSRWAASKQAASAMSPCVACNSSKPAYKLFKAPCGHIYCDECLEHLFELATTDESLFPPRCCKTQIPVETAKLYLSKGTIESFSEKIIEFGTPNRTYCFRPSCSSFLPPSSVVGDKGTCPQCGAATCTICKGESHSNDCPQDIATQEVLELASREGWQRCFNCKRLVELNFGCNHMR